MRGEIGGYNPSPPLGEHAHASDGRRKRKIKMPEMKYNKFQMDDLPSTPPTYMHMNHNHTNDRAAALPSSAAASGDGATSVTETVLQRADESSMTSDVREIRRYLRMLHARIQQKEEFGKITAEWRIVALVLDRIFFCTYVAAIVISLVTMFPRTY